MADPIDTSSFAELLNRMQELVDLQTLAVRRLLVMEIVGPGPIPLSHETHGGKQLRVSNGNATAVIVADLPADAIVGTLHLVRQTAAAPIKFVGAFGATISNRYGHNGTAGVGANVKVACEKNDGGSSALWVLEGETAALA